MHLAGMTEAALVDWTRARGASEGSARKSARALVARFAGRGAGRLPEGLDDSLPGFEVVPDPDGTVRFAVRLADGAVIETVLIRHAPPFGLRPSPAEPAPPQRGRDTVCLSSQVGCARGCVFCETGRAGLLRNLEAAEIVAQYAIVARWLGARPSNAVFMGMGEPLDNLDEVVRAIEVLSERAGFAVPERRITVSTVGVVPKIDALFARTRANLAVSLHAVDRKARLALLPIARRYPLEALRAAIARAPRTVLVQWTLIEGVNDRAGDADALIGFCRGLDVRVNLIPLNPGPVPSQRAPSIAACRAFQKRLLDAGLRTMLRLPHGQAVGGACGQLAGGARTVTSPILAGPTR